MTQFGPYQLLQHLAAGGMGEIYLAKLQRGAGFEKVVVIKRILPNFSQDPAFVAMFQREACIAAQLNHENVVQIFDYGQHAGSYFIAMEYVHGRDLRTVLDRAQERGEQLDPAVAAALLTRACSGLHYAHHRKELDGTELGIIHRDVSPQNILVSYEGGLKLTDFGLALREAIDPEATGQVQGKYAYMSPEQTWGDGLDRRSDIFSLGIVAYELFCGQRPFQGSVAQVVTAIRKADYPPLSQARPSLPQALELVLARAMAPRPEDRYPDVRAFRDALERVAAQEGWRAGADEIGELVARTCPEHLVMRGAHGDSTAVAGAPIAAQQGTAVAQRPVAAEAAPTGTIPAGTVPAADVPTGTVPAATPMRPREEDSAPPSLAPLPPKASSPRGPRGTWAWWGVAAALLLVAAGLLWTRGQDRSALDALEPQAPPREPLRQGGAVLGAAPTPAPSRAPGSSLLEDEPGQAQGQVILYVLPHDAQVSLGGEVLQAQEAPQGEAARYLLTREPGPIEVELSREGYQPIKQRVTVPTRTALSLNLELRPKPVRVEVRPSRSHLGRVILEAADGYRTECGLPCITRVPTPGEVRVRVTLDGREDVKPWGAARQGEPGQRLLFTVPVPEPVQEPEARLRVQLSGKASQRVAMLDANLLRKNNGSRRVKLDQGPAVTLRYDYQPDGSLSITLASDPWSAVTLDGAAIGQTPVVKRQITPGYHRVRLSDHDVTLTLRYTQKR